MTFNRVLVRYGELALKSKRVRDRFENKLVSNIKACLKSFGFDFPVKRIYGRIIIEGYDKMPLERVFGIVSFSPCIQTSSDLGDMKEKALSLAGFKGSFAVRCSRTGKHSYTSKDVEKLIGASVVEKTGCKVDLTKPDNIIGIDIRDKDAYIYTKTYAGPGGLPAGVQGKVLALIENEYSVLAACLMMKRGCSILPVFYKVKTEKFLDILNNWSYGIDLHPIEVGSLDNLDKLAEGCQAISTGDFELNKIRNFGTTVLMPLVGMEKKEIEKRYEKLIKV